jgi:hypothetical protein
LAANESPALFPSLNDQASVLSQKFAHKVFLMGAVFLQPRQGRKIVAQGASPGGGPSPRPSADGHPSPARAGEGTGVREGSLTHGLRRGLHSFARSAG